MKRGFTLLELLVVIVILLLLAGILFPVVARARDAAHRTVSLGNVKQIAFAQFLYMGDNDDTVAMNRNCTLVNERGGFAPCQLGRVTLGWIDLVSPYVKSYRVFKSPSDPVEPIPLPHGARDLDGNVVTAGFIWGPRLDGETLGGEYRSSYARNNNFANNGTYTAVASEASNPATLVLIYSFTPNTGAGANGNEGIPGSSFTIVRRPHIQPSPGTCVAYSGVSTGNQQANFYQNLPVDGRRRELLRPSSERYNGVGIYAFADGHAKSFRPERIHGQCNWGFARGVEFGNNGSDPDFRF